MLALLLARAGDLPEAQRAAAAGLALHPNWRPLHYVAGRLAAAAGSPADAARYRAAAVPGGADSTLVLRELGSLLVRSACWPEAADIYRGLYRHDKSWPTANALAWSLVNLARSRPADRLALLAEARAAADAAVKAAPADARKHVLDTLAAIQWEGGEEAEAMATMEALTRESPWEDLYRRRLETYRLQAR